MRALELGLTHARAWQQLHVDQRLKAMNFFVIVVAFLTTAYVAAFPDRPMLALFVAFSGVFISLAFNRMELRARALVKVGEAALKPLEARLATITGIDAMAMTDRAEHSQRFTSYAKVIGAMHWVATLGFGAAAWAALERVM